MAVNDISVPDEIFGKAVLNSVSKGVISWGAFIANVIGVSPLCSDTHIECPRCRHAEDFEKDDGPQTFKTYDQVNNQALKPFLTWTFRCPNCGHGFALVDGNRFQNFLEQKQREREEERRSLRGY
jgi:hypothetical protein